MTDFTKQVGWSKSTAPQDPTIATNNGDGTGFITNPDGSVVPFCAECPDVVETCGTPITDAATVNAAIANGDDVYIPICVAGSQMRITWKEALLIDCDGGGVPDVTEVVNGGDPTDPADDICLDPSVIVEINNLGGNLTWKVSNNPATGVLISNLGGQINYYDFSNCPQATVPVTNLGDNITYQLLP